MLCSCREWCKNIPLCPFWFATIWIFFFWDESTGFLSFIYICTYRWRSIYQQLRVGIILIGLTCHFIVPVPNQDLDFQHHIVVCSMGWGERWCHNVLTYNKILIRWYDSIWNRNFHILANTGARQNSVVSSNSRS